jgi:DnaK suppressor protein
MDTKKLMKFKKLLLEEKERILNNSKKSFEDITLDTNDLADETDLASAELNQELALKLRERERLILAEIDAALLRMEEGEYGICEETGEPIEEKRLEKIPWTRLSLHGAEIREKQRKRYAG